MGNVRGGRGEINDDATIDINYERRERERGDSMRRERVDGGNGVRGRPAVVEIQELTVHAKHRKSGGVEPAPTDFEDEASN